MFETNITRKDMLIESEHKENLVNQHNSDSVKKQHIFETKEQWKTYCNNKKFPCINCLNVIKGDVFGVVIYNSSNGNYVIEYTTCSFGCACNYINIHENDGAKDTKLTSLNTFRFKWVIDDPEEHELKNKIITPISNYRMLEEHGGPYTVREYIDFIEKLEKNNIAIKMLPEIELD